VKQRQTPKRARFDGVSAAGADEPVPVSATLQLDAVVAVAAVAGILLPSRTFLLKMMTLATTTMRRWAQHDRAPSQPCCYRCQHEPKATSLDWSVTFHPRQRSSETLSMVAAQTNLKRTTTTTTTTTTRTMTRRTTMRQQSFRSVACATRRARSAARRSHG
jgi:hypothetical protein